MAEILAESSNLASGSVFEHHAVSGGPRITASAAVNVSDEMLRWGSCAGALEQTSAAGVRMCRHIWSLQRFRGAYLPAASRVARRDGRFAEKIRSCAPLRL